MRNTVLWRKQARIIMALAAELSISEERALDLFYSTETCRQLSNPKYGLQLMSDARERKREFHLKWEGDAKKEVENDKIRCCMIMPISTYGTCSEELWTDVRAFLEKVIRSAGFIHRSGALAPFQVMMIITAVIFTLLKSSLMSHPHACFIYFWGT